MAKAKPVTKRFRGRSFFGRGLKARSSGVLLTVPGIEECITIPAFNTAQHIAALRMVEHIGHDFDLCYKLASFIFEKIVTDWALMSSGSTPGNRVYESWLHEFKLQNNIIFATSGAA
ncbi:hypothetical protein HYT45_01620 [Candidatus Uhrbacteria bacterium]|nr:hypothetical protein [Candidatus Uhrbacteria bacterium]